MQQVAENFSGDYRLTFHLAPPLFARPGAEGRPRKMRFGPWLMPLLRLLAGLRRVRGSWLDPFRFGPERAVDRQLLADYEADLDRLAYIQDPEQRRQLAAWPQAVRGFGPLRATAAQQARQSAARIRASADT